MKAARWWPRELPGDGHGICPLLAITGRGFSGQGAHPLTGEGLAEADAVSGGLADVGVVQEPVDGRGGEGLGHQFVERRSTRLRGCARAAPTVTVGNFPVGIAVDEATHTVYVGNGGDNTVSVINTATCNATNTSGCAQTHPTVAVGDFPVAVAVDRLTATVYVANNGTNTVSVFNGATCNATVSSGCGQTPATVTVGNAPGWVAVDDATHTLYVPADNTVSVVNAVTCNATDTSGCSRTPTMVTVGSGAGFDTIDQDAGTVYVTNSGDNTVSMINKRTCNADVTVGCGVTPATFQTGVSPTSLALNDSTHTLYVANGDDNTLWAVNDAACNAVRSSGCARAGPSVRVGRTPSDVVFDERTNTLYTVNSDSDDVSVVNAATCNAKLTNGCTRFSPTVATGGAPFGVAVNNKTNTVYIANSNDNTVSVINGSSCNAANTSGCGQTPPTLTSPTRSSPPGMRCPY
jgi:YVTN family beta-propeller protein